MVTIRRVTPSVRPRLIVCCVTDRFFKRGLVAWLLLVLMCALSVVAPVRARTKHGRADIIHYGIGDGQSPTTIRGDMCVVENVKVLHHEIFVMELRSGLMRIESAVFLSRLSNDVTWLRTCWGNDKLFLIFIRRDGRKNSSVAWIGLVLDPIPTVGAADTAPKTSNAVADIFDYATLNCELEIREWLKNPNGDFDGEMRSLDGLRIVQLPFEVGVLSIRNAPQTIRDDSVESRHDQRPYFQALPEAVARRRFSC